MKLGSRRLFATVAALTFAAGGAVATATPASAAFNDCPVNYLCLWLGSSGGNPMVFRGDGSLMSGKGGYWTSDALATGKRPRSSNNRTLGTFCTYSSNLVVTNILAPGTSGDLANSDVRYVRYANPSC